MKASLRAVAPTRATPAAPQPINSMMGTLPATLSASRSEQTAEESAKRVTSGGAAPSPPAMPPAHAAGAAMPPVVREALRSGGQPLDPATRAWAEPRFGHDFSRVRVHTGSLASTATRAAGAQAYTVGHHVVFGERKFAPRSAWGLRLLAHELAHVVQQGWRGAPVLQRKDLPGTDQTNYRFDTYRITEEDLSDPEIIKRLEALPKAQLRLYRERVSDPAVKAHIDTMLAPRPVAQYDTSWLSFDPAKMAEWEKAGYWYQRVEGVYTLTFSSSAWERFDKNTKERDVVLAALWEVRPTPLTAPATRIVSIPAGAGHDALVYRFQYSPASAAGAKDGVELELVRADPRQALVVAPEPPEKFKGKHLKEADEITSFEKGFAGTMDAYWKQHPEERRRLYFWIEQQGVEFDQLVTVQTATQGAGRRETVFHVQGNKDKRGRLTHLDVEYIAPEQFRRSEPSQEARAKDAADFLIEQAQTTPHKTSKDFLGEVWVGTIPQTEAFSVKFAIVSYWNNGTRNAEVDAIVPIAGTGRTVLYSLRFRPNNDVDVERVGDPNATPALALDTLQVERAEGYAANATAPARLKSWLKTRYPALTPTGDSVPELSRTANEQMTDKADEPDWFKKNYAIYILSTSDARARMKSVHKFRDVQLDGIKDYLPAELRQVEQALQPMQPPILKMLQQVRMGRQSVSIDDDEVKGTYAPNPKWGGKAFYVGTSRTVLMFDSGMRVDSSRHIFLGGGDRAVTRQVATITHELGHTVEYKSSSIRTAFNKFVKEKGIAPFTSYAGTKPTSEFFPEAFFIYQTDPEWMRRNYPMLYDWFQTLSRTGKPPA